MDNTNELIKELSTNFIEYAAACNSDRALPDSKSGLKPVARRILFGMLEGGRVSSKPHVKCARIVGDVMGSLHPHGDSSIYGALVRLSQPWIMRYPLIDFHGNQGSINGDGPAAYRYTEARLSKITEDGILKGLKKKNVDFIPNYDETIEEPVTLPAIFPNLLCNPNTGIGVAMACNFAPHNLKEVAQAIHDYVKGEEPMLPGPDFPTGGIVINKDDVPAIMRSGHGSVKVRAKYKVEKQNLVFYEIPYGTSTEALIAEIGKVAEEELSEITNIRNESNKKGLRIVVECKKDVNPDAIANKLFTKTNLQTSFSYNQVALINKTPTEVNLKDCIKIYLNHNIECLIKECDFDLKKTEARLEIVEGLLKALQDIDTIITFIKKSASSAAAKDGLVSEFGFTEPQAKSIVAMRLGSLAKLEGVELNDEKAKLNETIDDLNRILGSEIEQLNVILDRLDDLVKKYGDARRTELAQIEVPKEEKEIAEVIPEDVVVILSQNGDIKRIPKASFRTQRKGGKGVKTADDAVMATIRTNTIDALLLFTNKGKMYRMIVDNIPVGTNVSKGTNVSTLINLEFDEKVIAITNLARENDNKYVVFITKNGLIKKTLLEEYTKTKKGTGIAAIKLKEDDSIANIELMNEEDLILITKQGMSIHFETKDIAAIGRVTAGVKSIKLDENDEVLIGLPVRNTTDTLAIFTKNGLAKKTKIEEYPVQGRVGRGVAAYKVTEISGEIAAAAMINDENNLLLIGQHSICISATDIPLLTRIANGNIMIKDSKINSVVKL